MALGETARLIAALELQDKFSGPLKGANSALTTTESHFKRVGALASQGLGTATRNLQLMGLAAGGALVVGVKQGLDSLATLESAISSVDGAIKNAGEQGAISGKQIAQWANEIESAVGAAFDDKDITAAAATLIRYGHVAPQALRPAMVVMTDLAAKVGSVDGASQLLAKALADPEKAAGKLAKAGVILTKAQQDQIKTMVEAGNTAGAQALLLDALATATRGAAAASQGPYQRAMSTLKDVVEDVERALAIGFLPVLEHVAELLKGKLADQSFLSKVEEFGRTLAGYLDRGVQAAERIPWQQIGDAMKLAGTGAKAAADLFLGLPDWVQTAVLTGWGLNKLTGGALGGIVSELGKGLIKGVLGMNAAVVNLTAGQVNTAGGAGAAAAAGGGRFGAAGSLLKGLAVGVGGALVVELIANQFGELQRLTAAASAAVEEKVAGIKDNSLSTSLSEVAGLGDTIKRNSSDLIQAVLMQTGTGRRETIDAFKALEQNLERTAQTPEERQAALVALQGLAQTISEKFSATTPEQQALKAQLDAMLSALEHPTGPTPVVPGPGFTDWMHANTQQSEEQKQELQRIAQLQEQLPAQMGNTAKQLNSFIERWAGAHDAALAAGFKSGTAAIRREIADKLGITVHQLVQLRTSFRANLAHELGITTGELRHLRRSTHYDEQAMADSLGITVDQLRALKDSARDTAANTLGIKNKDWTPEINVQTEVHSNFTVSGRSVATSVERFWDRSRARAV